MTVWMKVCAFLLLLGMCGLNSYAADDDIIPTQPMMISLSFWATGM